MKVNIVNIGCFKNLVDCEYLIWQLQDCGIDVVFGDIEGQFDVAILNTCGFISDAENDSKALISRYIQRIKDRIPLDYGVLWTKNGSENYSRNAGGGSCVWKF
jgi:ribosomal protein S12 methylthiotransferase